MNVYFPRSLQAPADPVPVDWTLRPLSDIGAPANVVSAAKELGISTLEDLSRLEDWTEIPGVGAVRAEKMKEVYDAYRMS